MELDKNSEQKEQVSNIMMELEIDKVHEAMRK
jgi:hypothetical protein